MRPQTGRGIDLHEVIMRKILTAASAAAIAAVAIMLAAACNPAAAEERYRGRCRSMITGTDLGFVYGSSYLALIQECSKIATRPIVTNVQRIQ
jgi:hypothetical protein